MAIGHDEKNFTLAYRWKESIALVFFLVDFGLMVATYDVANVEEQ
jgi:hypothetical protein